MQRNKKKKRKRERERKTHTQTLNKRHGPTATSKNQTQNKKNKEFAGCRKAANILMYVEFTINYNILDVNFACLNADMHISGRFVHTFIIRPKTVWQARESKTQQTSQLIFFPFHFSFFVSLFCLSSVRIEFSVHTHGACSHNWWPVDSQHRCFSRARNSSSLCVYIRHSR